jgi:hypothetical protein
MRRILLVLTVGLVMAAIMAVTATSAFAEKPNPEGLYYFVCDKSNDNGHPLGYSCRI